jgi:hypothetical protein
LIVAVQQRVEEANSARDRAAQAVRDAELALARAELEASMSAFDERIRRIEARLCEAIAQRFELGVQYEGSVYSRVLHRHWKPTEPLRRAVVEGAVPTPNQTH